MKFAGSSKSSTPPPVFEVGTFDGRFEGTEAIEIEQSQYEPEAFAWRFTVLDDDGKVIYTEPGEPFVVEKITSRSVNVKSKTVPGAVKVLKALMTEDEFKAFSNEEEVDGDDLIGRIVQLDIERKENGWPLVAGVLRARRRSSK